MALKLFNPMTSEEKIIANNKLAIYDVRLWRVVSDGIKGQAIRSADIEAKRQKKKPVKQKSKFGKKGSR